MLYIPISITVAPFLIMFPRINPGLPVKQESLTSFRIPTPYL